MLRCANQIRLLPRDVKRLTKVAGICPPKIRTVEELNSFVQHCQRRYTGPASEERLLHMLLEKEKIPLK